MTLEKGAMIFHMLRWEMGDEVFTKFLRTLLSNYTDKSVRTRDLTAAAEDQGTVVSGPSGGGFQLAPFFAQWVDGTGAPQFNDKYTVYRLGNNKGFRTVGAISQDLDLFRMPVELRIETEGKTETRRVDVSGTDSSYSVETFGRPRRITIDPQGWLLKSTPDLAVRVAVLRGQQLVGQGDLTGALVEYQKALDANKNLIPRQLPHRRNLLHAAQLPVRRQQLPRHPPRRWRPQAGPKSGRTSSLAASSTCTGQRERAVNEYRLGTQTNDNTQGAVNEARNLMTHPYTKAQTDN